MDAPCPRCLLAFPRHLVVHAACRKRWRGPNFDAANAEAALGAAVAEVLGLRVRTTPELEAFLRKALVRTYPLAAPDEASPEPFEFHVGLRESVDDATFARIEQAAREAVAKSRHFELR